MEVTELRKHAKKITFEFESKGYTFDEVDLLVAILKDEIRDCKKESDRKPFLAIR